MATKSFLVRLLPIFSPRARYISYNTKYEVENLPKELSLLKPLDQIHLTQTKEITSNTNVVRSYHLGHHRISSTIEMNILDKESNPMGLIQFSTGSQPK